MTTPKNVSKGNVASASRRPRLTKAEIDKRKSAQQFRENLALSGDQELANQTRDLAFQQPNLFDHELLLVVADRLESRTERPQFIGGAPMRPFTYGPVGAGTPSQVGPIVFNSPTGDVEPLDGKQ